MNTVGRRIRELRRKNGWTQKELAAKVNVSSQVISNWERGYTNPNDENIVDLSEAFQVSADYILGRTNDPTPLRTLPTDDDIGPEPHRNPLGIELTPEQVELLREMRDDPEVLGMFRDFANSTEDERRMMLEIWETIRRRRKTEG